MTTAGQPTSVPPQPPAAKEKSSVQWVALALVALVLIGAGAAVVFIFIRPGGSSGQKGAATSGPTVVLTQATKVLGTPDVTIAAEDMIENYKRNEEEANKLFKDKIIEVTGQISGKPEGALGGYQIALGGGVNGFRGVRATLAAENVAQFKDVVAGGIVTIRGRCDELTTHIELKESAILKYQPPTE